ARLAALRALPPPGTTIVSGPSGQIKSRTVTFTYFTQSRAGRYSCRLTKDSVAGSWSPCNGQATTLGPLADGSYTFEVAATDESGAKDSTPATRSFSIATTGPPVTITAGPPPDGPPRSSVFAFSSPVPGVTYECRVAPFGKGRDWGRCRSSYDSLAAGLWSFEVRATDGSGGTTDPPAQWLFRFDDGGPTMVFDVAPHFWDQAGSGVITFHPGEPVQGSSSCRLDGGPAIDCTSGLFSYSGLGDGVHKLTVRSTDLSGTVANRLFKWNIDRAAPIVTVSGGPGLYTRDPSAAFSLSSSDADSTLYCRLDPQPFFTQCGATPSYDGLTDGAHTFAAMASDQAKNFSARSTWTWTVDRKAPTVRITSEPPSPSPDDAAQFAFSADEPTATFVCSLDSAPYGTCTSPVDYSGLADGTHLFAVRATDAAGNSSALVTYSWTVDTTPPQVTIESSPPSSTASTDAEFRFSADDNAAAFSCSLDGADYAPCASPTDYTGLAEGTHVFAVRASDPEGNVSAPETFGWRVDLTPPIVTIDSGPSDPTPSTSAEVAFASDDPAAAFRCSLDGAEFAACASPVDYDGLGESQHLFAVRATDAAGNTRSVATYGWTVDLTSPGATIDSGPVDPTSSGDAELTFSSDDASATFTCSLDEGDRAPCASPVDYTGLAEGSHVFSVLASDAAGNTSEAVFRW